MSSLNKFGFEQRRISSNKFDIQNTLYDVIEQNLAPADKPWACKLQASMWSLMTPCNISYQCVRLLATHHGEKHEQNKIICDFLVLSGNHECMRALSPAHAPWKHLRNSHAYTKCNHDKPHIAMVRCTLHQRLHAKGFDNTQIDDRTSNNTLIYLGQTCRKSCEQSSSTTSSTDQNTSRMCFTAILTRKLNRTEASKSQLLLHTHGW